MLNRKAVLAHAELYWFRPCQDGNVWLNDGPITINEHLFKKFNLNSVDWECVFLQENSWTDHLFAVRKNRAWALSTFQYDATLIAVMYPTDYKKIQDWRGLNDCAHFVSECLSKGGFTNGSLDVGTLVNHLIGSGSVKLLTDLVTLDDARAVAGTGIVKEADIIAYGASGTRFSVHAHSVIVQEIDTTVIGYAKVAVVNHTRLNHKDFNGSGGGHDNWTEYTTGTGHPLVSILHFSHDDPLPMKSRHLHGWWEINWRTTQYYYFFLSDGSAIWSRQKPASAKALPHSVPLGGRGHWFNQLGMLTSIWQSTGSVEQFTVIQNPTKGRYEIDGRHRGIEPISGVQLL